MTGKPKLWTSRMFSDNTMARARRDYEVIENTEDRPFSIEEIVEISSQVDAILAFGGDKLGPETAARISDRVKIIANHSVGVDHCDLEGFKARGVIVTNTPDVLSDATAETAILLMLAAARRAYEGEALVRSGQWSGASPKFMVGQQITGKRFGVIGMGRIGGIAAERARGFGMEIHYYNRNPRDDAGDAIYHDTVEDLIRCSDVLSLHCPATPENRGMINAERLSLLPDGAILVNTARGSIIDDDALIEGLKAGKPWAAGLDVFNNEPALDPRYRDAPNAFLLPHIGSATFETRDAMGFRALDNIDAYFAGREPGDRVA